MQIHDRLRLLVVTNSLGECDGMGRLYHSLGLPPLNKPLALWVASKDTADQRMHDFRRLPRIKKLRAEEDIIKWKEGVKKDKKAEKEGCACGSGIANTQDVGAAAAVTPRGQKET